MALFIISEVKLVDDVNDLTQKYAILHILVGILECGANYGTTHRC